MFMNIYACLCMFIHIYTYSCMKNFLPVRTLRGKEEGEDTVISDYNLKYIVKYTSILSTLFVNNF